MRRKQNEMEDLLVKCKEEINPDSITWQVEEYLGAMRIVRKPKTVQHARHYLYKFAQWCIEQGVQRVQDLKPKHIRAWQLYLMEHYERRATIWSINCDVRAFLRWCVKEKILRKLPFEPEDLVPKPKPQPKPMRPEEVNRLLKSLQSDRWMDARDRALVVTFLYTGARRGEVLQMKVADVERMSFIVTQKGDIPHVIHINQQVVNEINRYLRLYVKQTKRRLTRDDLLWRARNGEPLTGNALRLVMRRLAKRSGVDVWCHRFRATCATWRIARGAPTKAVQQALGHQNIVSIEHYAKLANEDLKALLEDTNPLDQVDLKRPYR